MGCKCYMHKFYADDKVRKPNKFANFLLHYRGFLLNNHFYKLVSHKSIYRELGKKCNHPYQIPTSSKGFMECECCFEHFEKGEDENMPQVS